VTVVEWLIIYTILTWYVCFHW